MTTINAKKGDLVSLINGLYAVQDIPGKTFGLAVSKNVQVLQEALRDLEELGKPTQEFMELAQKVNAITEEGAEDSKDKIAELELENVELVQSRRDQIDKTQIAMTEEMSIELRMIKEDELPEVMTAKQLTALQLVLE